MRHPRQLLARIIVLQGEGTIVRPLRPTSGRHFGVRFSAKRAKVSRVISAIRLLNPAAAAPFPSMAAGRGRLMKRVLTRKSQQCHFALSSAWALQLAGEQDFSALDGVNSV